MLRKAACLALFAFLAALAATAAGPVDSAAGVDLSWLAPVVEAPNSTPADMAPLDLAKKPAGIRPKATCTATCSSGTVTCTYTSPTTCTAVDQNCSVGQTGYVQCGTAAKIFCSPGCPICTPGQIMFIPTGACCDNGTTEKDKYVCNSTGTDWDYTGTFCKLPLCGPQSP